MPQTRFPPTPGSSTDIHGKEKLVNLAPALILPPAAYADAASDRAASSTPSSHCSESSYHPHSPVSPDHTRRRSGAAAAQSRTSKTDDAFTLPPPPTRSRKIIQMKPKTAAADDKQQATGTEAPAAKAPKKRGGANGGTAASRKVARKTAHSLIERRRRSKMNEEFGVLKDMIPACNGQEMHKLAILQASIDYLRYLERCISDLKATNEASAAAATRPPSIAPPASPTHSTSPRGSPTTHPHPHRDQDRDQDQEMPDCQAPTPRSHNHARPRTFNAPAALSTGSRPRTQPSTSPVFSPFTSASSATYSPYVHPTGSAVTSPYIHSAQTSPFFLPTAGNPDHASGFSLTSPALLPLDSRERPAVGAGSRATAAAAAAAAGGVADDADEEDKDREAMAALLMLNSDRRASRGSRGMSVRDLLM